MLKKKKVIIFQRAASVFMILTGVWIFLISLLGFLGSLATPEQLAIEIGARRVSELFLVFGMVNFTFGILFFVTGVMGCMYASKGLNEIERCQKMGSLVMIVTLMFLAFLIATSFFSDDSLVILIVATLYNISVRLNKKAKTNLGEV